MRRIEIQRANLAYAVNEGNPLVDEPVRGMLDGLIDGSKIIELRGMGLYAEYLSRKGHEVDLVEEDVTHMRHRGHILPDSTVAVIPVHPSRLQVSEHKYDVAIVNDRKDLEVAKLLAPTVIIPTELKSEQVTVNEPEKTQEETEAEKKEVQEEDIPTEEVVIFPAAGTDTISTDVEKITEPDAAYVEPKSETTPNKKPSRKKSKRANNSESSNGDEKSNRS